MNALSCALCATVGLVLAARAGTVLDFGAAKDLKWKIWTGAFADPKARARQLAFSPDGLCATIDRLRTTTIYPALTLGLDKAQAPQIPVGARLSLTYRVPADSVVDRASTLVVQDAEGERFSFAPVSIERSGERQTAVYLVRAGGHVGGFAATRPATGRTGGTNRNDRLDAPLHLHTLAFSFHPDRTRGTVILERLEADDVDAQARQTVRRPLVTFREADADWAFGYKAGFPSFWRDGRPATTGLCTVAALKYRSFPGLKPVPGMKAVSVTTDSRLPLAGAAVLHLVNPATGEKKHAKAKWQPVTRFATDLPHDTLYQFDRIEFWPKKGTPVDFAVTAMTGEWEETAAESVLTRIETGNPLFLVRTSEERPQLVLENTSDRPCAVTGEWRVCDFWGNGPTFATSATLSAHETRRFPVPGAVRKGLWRVLGALRAEDGSMRRHEHRFAVLDPVAVTPRWPLGRHFRMGVNYHASRFAPGDLRRTMDALSAIGVKLARVGGFHFNSCAPAAGVYDWTKSDRIMAEGVAHGISFDAGIYPPPAWAKDPAAVARFKGHRKAMFVPSHPGLMRDYAEAVAARYGTKIDYYELGNEWDLVPAEILPEEDAIRLQREAWEGLKKGCPDAKLIPNGWTSDMTFDRPGMNRRGFQERFMLATKGFYDFHPTHMHSVFPRYVEGITRLLEQRRRLGLDHVPWYSNETALTTVNGNEEEAARTLWKKILFAWSRGSCDYIWYNLKATGWVPSDPEQAYGLIMADYQPRATYAALAGLIATAQGLAFDATLADGKTRWVFRMKGAKPGFSGIVLAGWDSAAPQKGCALRVKTDAKKAYAVDLFGNRTALALAEGLVGWSLGTEPAALLLADATRAEPVREDLANRPTPALLMIPAAAPETRTPDFTLDRVSQTHDLYEADPSNVRRTWKGPADLSAHIWLAQGEDGLRVKAVVTDDAAAPGDDVVLILRLPKSDKPVTVSLGHDPRVKATRTTRGVETTYEALLPYAAFAFAANDLKTGLFLAVRVMEDDGDGPDGWLQTASEDAPLRFVRFH